MTSSTDHLLNLGEAAERLRIGTSTLRRLVARGELRVVRIGRRVLLPPDAVVEFVDRHRGDSPD